MPARSGPIEAAQRGACTPPVRDNADIYETLRTVLCEKFDIDPARIDPEAMLEHLGLDYLAAVEVLGDLSKTVTTYQQAGTWFYRPAQPSRTSSTNSAPIRL